jgi:hypothetical protein
MTKLGKRKAIARDASAAARRDRQQQLAARGEDGRASTEVDAGTAGAAAAEAAAAGLGDVASEGVNEDEGAVAVARGKTERVGRAEAAARAAIAERTGRAPRAATATRAAAAERAAGVVRAATEAAATATEAGAQAQVQRQEAWWPSNRPAQAALDRWHVATGKIWGEKRCCALCGVGALGGSKQCDLNLQLPSRLPNGDVAQHAPVALLNPVTAQAALGPDGRWWVCDWCRTSTLAAREHNVREHNRPACNHQTAQRQTRQTSKTKQATCHAALQRPPTTPPKQASPHIWL